MVTMDAPWTSCIVASTSRPPGSPITRGVGSVRAIARVMKKNGSTTSRTSSSGRRACSRKPSRVAVITRGFTPELEFPEAGDRPTAPELGEAERPPKLD